MNQKELNFHRHLMALHAECMAIQVWEDDKDFRQWLYDEFKVWSRKQLTKAQKRRYQKWLLAYLGKGEKPSSGAGRITKRQRAKIEKLVECLGWTSHDLHGFIKRQTGEGLLLSALSKNQASDVINGLLKIQEADEATVSH